MTSPCVLVILDGWGYRSETDHNAIAAARTPVWDRLWAQVPRTLLCSSGEDVGLPGKQMGNSEVGHMHLGAGRLVKQDLLRIDQAIADGDFDGNAVLQQAFAHTRDTTNGTLHIMGLLSPGGVHSHERHIKALITLAAHQRVPRIYLHAFLDGRDTPPRSAAASLQGAAQVLAQSGGAIASICGRYYAMDRDNRWERTARAWRLLMQGKAEFHAADPLKALHAAYARGESDEFVRPTAIHAETASAIHIRPEDSVVFMNFRADRARQITKAVTAGNFDAFQRDATTPPTGFTTLTEYARDLHLPAIFPARVLANGLGEHLSALDRTQLRLAETEKYAHVTFFFNGGIEPPFPGEQRIMVPSPEVSTYDLRPDMSAHEITSELVQAIKQQRFDFIVCNYANGDMVGHTGVFPAAVQAVETIDTCLGKVLQAIDSRNGQCLVTADHGNVEQMHDTRTGQPHTAHTEAPVPLVYHGPRNVRMRTGGSLANVAPTLLELMTLPKPSEMTHDSLLQHP